MHALRRLLPALLVVLVAACGTDGTTAPARTAPTATATEPTATADAGNPVELAATIPFESPDGERVTFDVELVSEPATRQVGLMHRTELAEGTGMLFLFPADYAGGFWMKNTLIPLQIAYIAADGGIVDIMEMEPCTADPCPSYAPDGPYRYALEVNAGALDEAGIDDTWTVDVPDDLPDAT